MQTFLPYPSFVRSAAVLDDARLGKQRVEALQVLRAMHLEDYGWANHPVVQMWRGHTRALVAYGLAMVDEWDARGRPDTTRPLIAEFAAPHPAVSQRQLARPAMPPWLGSEALHRSHQSALVRKDPERYRAVFGDVPDDLPYEWPEGSGVVERERRFSAWVVRGAAVQPARENAHGPRPPRLHVVTSEGRLALDPELTDVHATPKQRRQRQLFEEVMKPGEPVAVPTGTQLLVGVLSDGPLSRDGGVLSRAVAWRRSVRRRELERPYQLQDPRAVFPIRGEPALQVVAPKSQA